MRKGIGECRAITLTTGTDTWVGTSGNDTFVADDGTFTAFDSIDGGAGTDSLIVTEIGAAITTAGKTVRNIETATLRTDDAITANTTTWTGLQTLNVTSAGGAVALTVANTTAVNVSGVELAAAGSVTVTGGSTVTLDGVTLDDNAGSDVTISGGALTAVSVSNTNLGASGGLVITDTNATAATRTLKTVTLDSVIASGAPVAITANLDTLNLTTVDEDVTLMSVAGARTLAINANEVGVGGSVTITDAQATAVTLDASGEDSDITLDTALATTLAVSGDAGLNLVNGNLTALASLTISGAVAVTADLTGANALTTITSTSTGDQALTIDSGTTSVTTGAGDDTITHTATALAATTAINTGAGDDRVVLGNFAPTAGATINGGEGTDTIAVVSACVNANHSAIISNFEVLEVTDALGQDLDVANFDSIQNVVLAAGSGAIAISGINSNATITYGAANTGLSTLTVTNALAGTADVINVVLNAGATANFNTIAAANVETVNVESTTTAADPTTVTNTVGLTIAAAETLNVTGDAELVISTALTSVETVAAADFDAGLTVDLTGNANDVTVTVGDGDNDVTGGNGDDTITTGNGDDIIDGGDGDDVIVAGNGANTITGGGGKDTMTGGTGVDTYVYKLVTDSQGTKVDVITNFQVGAGGDVIDLSAITNGGAYLGVANGYGAVLTSFTAGGSAEAVLDSSTSTLYIDINGDGVLNSSDMAIQLTGVTSGLVATNFTF